MFNPLVFTALLAAIPSVFAQNSTSTFTRCTTRFGFYPLPTGLGPVPTYYTYVQTTNTFLITSTLRSTITATLNATTCGGLITETSTVTTTYTTTPAAVTIKSKPGQLPLLYLNPTAASNPTPIPRIKRLQIAHDANSNSEPSSHLVNRQTSPGNTGGFIVNPDGTTSQLNRVFPHRVLCERRRIIDTTRTITITGAPTTVNVAGSTATAYQTTTVVATVTVVESAPTPRVYQACMANNVVNHIIDPYGNRLNFDRIVYREQKGLPIANEMVVNTTGPVNCCVACQDTPNCAGSFYVPSRRECHIRLTTPPSNATLPIPSGYLPAPSSGFPSASLSLSFPTASGAYASGYSSLPSGYPSLPSGSGAPVPPYANSSYSVSPSGTAPSGTGHAVHPTGGYAGGGYPSGVFPSGVFPTAPSSDSPSSPSSSSPSSSAAPDSNSEYPAYGVQLAVAAVPSSTPSAATCAKGSELYLGTIRGRAPSQLKNEFALYFSNGPCGRFAVSFLPV